MSSVLTPLHRAWRALPVRARRRWLARGTALLAPRPDRVPPPPANGLVVGGELDRASGLGEGARLMLQALGVMGVPCRPLSLDPFGKPPCATDGALPEAAPLVLHLNPPLLPWALRRMARDLGTGAVRGRRIVGYWAWELPVADPLWRRFVPFVHEIWVPSRFTADALEPLMPGRVRLVPHPVALRPPAPSGLGRADFGLPEDAVVTLCAFSLASSLVRKNPQAAIAAHRQAFGDRADRILLLKVGDPGHFPEDFAALQALANGAGNIRFLTRTLPLADHHALLACVDILISLHRSEGFGLVPAEAMLLGRPVVATGWSGTMDFMDEGTAALVGYRLVPAQDPRAVYEAPGAVWAEADVGQAADWLRHLADDPDARAALGRRGQRAARDRLGMDGLAGAVRALGLAA